MFDCNYFWRAVSISSDGSTEPCCHFTPPNPWTHDAVRDNPKEFDQYKKNKLLADHKIQNSKILTDIRKTVLEGGIPKGCQPCVECEKNGGESPRQKGYDSQRKKHINISASEKQIVRPIEHIEHMDLFMNNICNFKCVMCSEDFSHLIAKEKGIKNPIVNWGDNEEHILKFMRKAKNLKKITIAGGEPFYNIAYLHKVLEAVLPIAKNIKILITTNGSNKIMQQTADLLNQFKSVALSISVDAIGKHSEVQRVKSNWKQIESNIASMKDVFKDNVNIELNSTITAITLPNLPELLVWANDNDAIEWVHPSFVTYPIHLRIDVLKPEAIKDIKEQILVLHRKIQFKPKIADRCLGEIFKILDGVRPTAIHREKFDEYFDELKASGRLDLHKELPQFKNLLM